MKKLFFIINLILTTFYSGSAQVVTVSTVEGLFEAIENANIGLVNHIKVDADVLIFLGAPVIKKSGLFIEGRINSKGEPATFLKAITVTRWSGEASCFNVLANNVTIKNFIFKAAETNNYHFKHNIYIGNSFNCTITNNWFMDAISGVNLYYGGGCIIENNRFGTDGTASSPNNNGIELEFATNVTIKGNILSGNKHAGISMRNCQEIFITNNIIGLDITKNKSFGNQLNGILSNNNEGVVISDNVISGNLNNGIFIAYPKGELKIANNLIGTNGEGTEKISNGSGIYIDYLFNSDFVISDNVISGNTGAGMMLRYGSFQKAEGDIVTREIKGNTIGLSKSGDKVLGNKFGIYLDQTFYVEISDNLLAGSNISSHYTSGIHLNISHNVVIKNNKIGTDITGLKAFPNYNGIHVYYSENLLIEGNLVSGNSRYQINLMNQNGGIIRNNKIGTIITGDKAITEGSSSDGINLYNCEGITIGGVNSEDKNIISGNHNGIFFTKKYDPGDGNPPVEFVRNKVIGNYIGTTYNGSISLPNSNGIYLDNCYSADIKNNIISGNKACGIIIFKTNDVLIESNKVGTNISDEPLGNGEHGISIRSESTGNKVSKNTICDNGIGIVLQDGSNGNFIKSNLIGINSLFKRNGNKSHGILIYNDSHNNLIGGNIEGEFNTIANNSGDGININKSAGNKISRNNIYENTGKSISLNLSGEISMYGNSGKNHPVFTSFEIDAGIITIHGTSSEEGDVIEFFTSDMNSRFAYKYLSGYDQVAGNDKSFSVTIPLSLVPGGFISATATNNTNGNTSELNGKLGTVLNCGNVKPVFQLDIPCQGKPIITGTKINWSVSNFEPGFFYEFVVNDANEQLTNQSSNFYQVTQSGNLNIKVVKRLGSCTVPSDPQLINSATLSLNIPDGVLCKGNEASLTVSPSGFPSSDYIWFKNGVKSSDLNGSTIKVKDAGLYRVVVKGLSCPENINDYDNYTALASLPAKVFALESDLKMVECREQLTCDACIKGFYLQPWKDYNLTAWVSETYTGAEPEIFSSAVVKIVFYKNDGSGFPQPDNENAILCTAGEGSTKVEGWQRIDQKFTVPATSVGMSINLINTSGAGKEVFFDDIRIHPSGGNMKSFVYDVENLRLTATLDENNFAAFYEYDSEGKLIRVKKETEKGIMTIQETYNNLYKNK